MQVELHVQPYTYERRPVGRLRYDLRRGNATTQAPSKRVTVAQRQKVFPIGTVIVEQVVHRAAMVQAHKKLIRWGLGAGRGNLNKKVVQGAATLPVLATLQGTDHAGV
jgi:hypothetical protein